MAKLYPFIAEIEDRLFSPSERLIERWARHDPALKASTVVALSADPVACARREALLASRADETSYGSEQSPVGDPSEIELSPFMTEMFERRAAAGATFAGHLAPAPGQIRLVDRAIGPDGADLGWDMNYPLAVLLHSETEDSIWHGWMMGGEPDYATYWDVLLEQEDEPYDPLVAMVQLWNPVHIYGKSVGRVLGQLSDDRLHALVAAQTDFLTGERPDAEHARPGALVHRLATTGESLMTGTPTGGFDDPRVRYHDLYYAAAGMVKDVAQLAIAALVAERDEEPESMVDMVTSLAQAVKARLMQNLGDFAERLGRTVEPVTFVAAQGLAEAETQDQGLDWRAVSGLLETAVIPSQDGTSVRLLLRRVEGSTLTVSLVLTARLLQQHRLDETSPSAEIHFEPEDGLALEVEDTSGNVERWTLST